MSYWSTEREEHERRLAERDMKSGVKKTRQCRHIMNTIFHSMDGSIVYTTRSSKDTVKVRQCNCKNDPIIGRMMNRDWSCAEENLYYCPGCDQIECSSSVGASSEAMIEAAENGDLVRWVCLECNTYVFPLDPITSTALAMGLPMQIEEESWDEDSKKSDRSRAISDTGIGTTLGQIKSPRFSGQSEVDQSQVDQEESEV